MSSAQAYVVQLLAKGVPFARIEAYIEGRRDISEDERNALWLYAWATANSKTEGARGQIAAAV